MLSPIQKSKPCLKHKKRLYTKDWGKSRKKEAKASKSCRLKSQHKTLQEGETKCLNKIIPQNFGYGTPNRRRCKAYNSSDTIKGLRLRMQRRLSLAPIAKPL